MEIIGKKSYLPETCTSIEEYKLQFCTFILPVTFLLANFLHFSQQNSNHRKILSCFDTRIQICEEKGFRSY